jgi:hypothetical protein
MIEQRGQEAWKSFLVYINLVEVLPVHVVCQHLCSVQHVWDL